MVHFSLYINTCSSYAIWESKIKFGQKFLHPQKHALKYTYASNFHSATAVFFICRRTFQTTQSNALISSLSAYPRLVPVFKLSVLHIHWTCFTSDNASKLLKMIFYVPPYAH